MIAARFSNVRLASRQTMTGETQVSRSKTTLNGRHFSQLAFHMIPDQSTRHVCRGIRQRRLHAPPLAPKWAAICQPRATPWESVGENSEPQRGGSNRLGKKELGPRRWRWEMAGFNSQGLALGCHRDGPLGLNLIVLQPSGQNSVELPNDTKRHLPRRNPDEFRYTNRRNAS